MKKPISFKQFLALPEEIQEQLSTFENAYITEELTSTAHKKKMIELEKALKKKDWWWFMSDSGPDYKKGKSEEDKIKAMRDVLGDDGHALYKQFAIKAGVMNEAKKDLAPVGEYEAFLQMKMREWEIKSLDELEKSLLKKFWAEVDGEWKGNDEVEVNLPEKKSSIFPEMDKVVRNGLGYGDGDRAVGEKSKHGFVDAGNLYPEHLVPKWIPPSPQRKRGWADK